MDEFEYHDVCHNKFIIFLCMTVVVCYFAVEHHIPAHIRCRVTLQIGSRQPIPLIVLGKKRNSKEKNRIK